MRTSLEFSSLWPYVKRPAMSIWHSSSRSPYKQLELRRNSMKLRLFPDYVTCGWGISCILQNIFESKKFSINSNQWESRLRPYQHYVMGRLRPTPCRHAWLGLFVQLSPWWPLAMLLVWKRLYWPIVVPSAKSIVDQTCTFKYLIPMGDLSKYDRHGHASPNGYGP